MLHCWLHLWWSWYVNFVHPLIHTCYNMVAHKFSPFFRGCVSEMVVLSYSVIYYIYILGKLWPCFHFWCSVYGICKRSDTLWPVGRVCLFANYTISLSSLCRLIWRHWTTKMLVRYMLPSVCLRLRQFSQLSFIQYMGLCVFSLPISPVMIVRICTLSYYHHQTGSMNH